MSTRASRLGVPAVAAVGVALLATVVGAADPYREALARAVAAKEIAVDSSRDEDWRHALARLRDADEIRETATTKYEIGIAATRLSYEDLAVQSYTRAIELGLSGAARVKAETYLQEKASAMSHLVVRGPDGWHVTVNGVYRARLPLDGALVVRPGRAVVVIASPDDHDVPIERELELARTPSPYLLDANEPSLPTRSPPETQFLPKHEAGVPAVTSRAHVTSESKPLLSSRHGSFPLVDGGVDSWRQAGWALVSSGITLGVLSAAFIPLSNGRLAESRRMLLANCDVQVDGPDTCTNAAWGRQDVAQSASDSIATWKAARAVSVIGLAAGVAAMTSGLTILWAKPVTPTSTMRTRVSLNHRQILATVEGGF